jgi:hypothetical protein
MDLNPSIAFSKVRSWNANRQVLETCLAEVVAPGLVQSASAGVDGLRMVHCGGLHTRAFLQCARKGLNCAAAVGQHQLLCFLGYGRPQILFLYCFSHPHGDSSSCKHSSECDVCIHATCEFLLADLDTAGYL